MSAFPLLLCYSPTHYISSTGVGLAPDALTFRSELWKSCHRYLTRRTSHVGVFCPGAVECSSHKRTPISESSQAQVVSCCISVAPPRSSWLIALRRVAPRALRKVPLHTDSFTSSVTLSLTHHIKWSGVPGGRTETDAVAVSPDFFASSKVGGCSLLRVCLSSEPRPLTRVLEVFSPLAACYRPVFPVDAALWLLFYYGTFIDLISRSPPRALLLLSRHLAGPGATLSSTSCPFFRDYVVWHSHPPLSSRAFFSCFLCVWPRDLLCHCVLPILVRALDWLLPRPFAFRFCTLTFLFHLSTAYPPFSFFFCAQAPHVFVHPRFCALLHLSITLSHASHSLAVISCRLVRLLLPPFFPSLFFPTTYPYFIFSYNLLNSDLLLT